MTRRISATVSVLMFITTALGAPTLALRPDGYGRVKIGMTETELSRALKVKVEPDQDDSEYCFYVSSPKYPNISFMVEDKRLARIDVDKPGITTPEGIGVGDTEKRAKQVYGRRLKVEPHKYLDDGHYLTVYTADRKYATRFETDGEKITMFYAGRAKSIKYIEGCL
jgi:hypothetical protein